MNDYQRLKTDIVAVQCELTNICPVAVCAECVHPFMTRTKGHMSLDLARKVVKDCVDAFGPISFNLNGLGEPLSYPYLPEVIRYIGYYSPKSRIEIFTSLVCKDIPYAEDVVRALQDVPNNVLLAASYHMLDKKGEMIEATAQYFRFDIFYNAFIDNPKIDFHIAMNVSKWHTEEQKQLFLDTFDGLMPADKIHLVERLDSWFGLVSDQAVATSDVTNPNVCDYPYKVLHIGWDGRYMICCTDDVYNEMELGCIKKEPIASFWKSAIMIEIRERHNNLDVEGLKPCNKCGRTAGYIKR